MKILFLLFMFLFNSTILAEQIKSNSEKNIQKKINLTKEEKQWIKDNPTIKIGVMSYWLSDDHGNNIHTDILKLLNKYSNLNIKAAKFDTWKSGFNEATSGEFIHGVTNLSWSKERSENNFFYTNAYDFRPYHIIVRENNNNIKSLNDLENKTIYLKEESITYAIIKENVKKIKIIDTKIDKEMFEKLSTTKEADAFLVYEQNKAKLKKHNLKIAKTIYDKYGEGAIGISLKHPQLKSIIDKIYKIIPKEELVALQNKVYLKTDNKQIKFTLEEKKWIKANPIIKLAVMNYWSVGSNMHIDMVKLLNTYSNLNIIPAKFNTWKNGFNEATKGINTHGIMKLSWSKEREENNFYYSNIYAYKPYYLIVRKENNNINSLNDLENETIYLKTKAITNKIIDNNTKQVKIIELDTDNTMFKKLSTSRDAVAFISSLADEKELEKYNLKVAKVIQSKHGDLYIGISHRHPMLNSIIKKIYKTIPVKKITALQNKVYLKTNNNQLNFTDKEKQWIKDNPIIKIALMDFWKYNSDGDNIHTDIIKLINEYGNLNLTVTKFSTWKDGFKEASDGGYIHGITNLGWSKKREKNNFFYTKPYIVTPSYLVVKKTNNDIHQLSDLENKTIYLQAKTITHNTIENNVKKVKVIDLDSDKALYEKLSTSDEAVAFLAYWATKEKLEKYNLKIAKTIYDRYGEGAVGISHKHPQLKSIIDKVYAIIPKHKITAIQNKIYSESNNKQIKLTAKEKEWIEKNPIINLGIMSYWKHDDNWNSIETELINHINSYAKTNIVAKKFDKWKTGYNKATVGNELHGIMGLSYSKEREEKYFHYTKPYRFTPLYVVTRKDNKTIKEFSDLKANTIYVKEKSIIDKLVHDKLPSSKRLYFELNSKVYQKLQSNKNADAILTYFIDHKSLKKHNLKIAKILYNKDGDVAIGINHKYLQLHSIINKVMAVIPKNILTQLQNKKYSSTNIQYTKNERKWINTKPIIKYVYDINRAPFEYKNSLGHHSGISANILEMISIKTGIEFQPIETTSWLEATQLIRNRTSDMATFIIETKERKAHLNFSKKVLYKVPVVYLTSNEDTTIYENIQTEFKNKNIGFVQGRAISKKMKEKYPDFTYVDLESIEDGIDQMKIGAIDMIALNMATAKYYIKVLGHNNLHIAIRDELHFNFKMALQDNLPKEALSILDKALNNISDNEFTDIYNKHTNILVEEHIDYTLIWQILVVVFVILIIVFYWLRKISKLNHKMHKLNDNLQVQKDQLDTIFSLLPIPILIVAKNTKKIIFANKYAATTYKYTVDELVGSDINIIYTCDKQRGDILASMKDNLLINHETSYKLKDNSELDALLSIIPIDFNENEANLGVITDITHLKKVQLQLEEETKKAKSASKTKSEFLANMSHEIRTPMNAVIGFADLLSNLIKDPIQKDYLNSIQTGGKALLTIINDILDLSKIEAGKFEIVNEAINPRTLFQEMETIFQTKINQKNLHFLVDIDESLPHTIIADSVRIRQILINLVGNAIKFTNKGSITLKIENSFNNKIKSKLNLKISVIDTGRGIKEEFLSRIFTAFEQTESDDARKFAGTGLGLAISSKLATLMNGTINVKSQIDKGSTFEVNLKDIAVSSLKVDDLMNDIQDKRLVFDKVKILLVDDIPANRKLVVATLYDSDLEILEAKDGKDAVDIVSKNKDIKLVLMDLRMPVMDGYQATMKIREDKQYDHIPIIAFTASVMGEDLEKVEEFGFNGYLRKPIVYNDLAGTIKEYIPYKILNDDSEDKVEEDVLSDEVRANIPNVLEQLNGRFKVDLDAIKDKGDFMLIASLITQIEDLGKNNSLKIVEKYATGLLTAIDSFDIDKVELIINNYDTMCNKLETLK